jgi:hypothetical protein
MIRKSTLIRLVVLAMLIGLVGVTGINADTQTCQQQCDTRWNQCLAQCQWWNIMCPSGCNDQLTYCYSVCNGGGSGHGPWVPDYPGGGGW